MIKIMRAWDAGKNKVKFVYRDPETNRTKIGEESFHWYFYVKLSDYMKKTSVFNNLIEQGCISKVERDKEYAKVYVDREHTSDLLNKNCEFVWEYKDHELFEIKKTLALHEIQTYEADLLVHKRWIIDRGIPFESDFKVLMLDLETDDEKLTGQVDPINCKILSCAFKDFNTGKEAWIHSKDRSVEAERELCLQIAKVISSYDVLCAWNGNGFDFPVLKGRFAIHGIQIDWRKKFLQDQMAIYKKLGAQLQSYSLDYVAKAVVKRGKVEHDQKIFEMFLYNKPLLREYNLEDVRLMYDIELKTKFLDVFREVNTIGSCPCDDPYISRKIDNLILREAFLSGHYHFKTKVKEDPGLSDQDESFEGAFVFDPIYGLHDEVMVLDFHSLYPSVIQSFNLSTDTVLDKDEYYPPENTITSPTGHRFKRDFVGLIPRLIMDINNKRNRYKDLKKECLDKESMEYKTYDRLAYVFKFFSLSFYGVMGLKTSRFYDIRIAESTTLGGQYYTKMVASFLKTKDIDIVYGDTDSLFIKSKNKLDIETLIEEINKICNDVSLKKFNCSKSYLSIELDKIFKPLLLFKAKKRYAGYLIYLDGKEIPKQFYVKGLEYTRTDSCQILKSKQKELISNILDEKLSEESARKYILELRNHVLYKLNDIEEIKIAKKLTKEPEDYKASQAHLTVVEDLRSKGIQVYVGDKIDYFISSLNREGKPVPKAARFFDGKFDRLYFWSNIFYPALERVLEAVFQKTNWAGFGDFGSQKKMANTPQGRMNLW